MSAPPSRPSVQAPKQPTERPEAALPAASTWLVDGYNVLHCALLGGEPRAELGWWGEQGRGLLLARIENFDRLACEGAAGARPSCRSGSSPGSIWVVFDGPRPAPAAAQGGPQIVFAPSADHWIVSRVRASSEPQDMAVVSADRQLTGRCRHAGAAVVSPKDFIAHCGAASG